MKIALSTGDAASRAELARELSEAGHDVLAWSAADPAPADLDLAIVDGLEEVVLAHEVKAHLLALVEPSELVLFPECPRQVTDFVLKPVRPGEVAARANHLATQPSWREQVHHRLLAMAVDVASDIVELTTPAAVLEYVNPAYEQVLGIPAAEAIGHTPASLVRSDAHAPDYYRAIGETLDRGEPWSGVLISRARDGRLVHLDSHITPIFDRKGQITHHAAVKRDITDRLARQEAMMEANRALEQARDAAVAASRAKSEFLANMSHELRTPLNAIIGYSEMLLEDSEDEQASKDLQRIRTAGSHLLSLINDVLDISKIEADKIELSPETFAIAELAEAVNATIEPLAARNGNRFACRLPDGAGAMYADRTRLRQILLNLLSNACKFTKGGQVSLEVERRERDGAQWVAFHVRDTGIGISAEHRAKLFQPFVQADSSTTREFGGTGLGLVISKRFTEMMGGRITLESEPGVGSTFTVHLPAASEPLDAALVAGLPGQPVVLLIDDDADTRDLFSRVLSKRGFRVELAASGPQGIDYAGRLRPDVIVLDVKMPGMSGWEVLSTLKLAESTAKIPVIMLTVMQQREVGQALGAIDYLIKPVDPNALASTLRRHVKSAVARVLLVEDDEPTRELMRRTLEDAGHVVSEAEHGQAGLDRLEADAPDIVVLDLMMPVMDGFSFLHHLRKDVRFGALPVIVATARHLSDAERRELASMAQRVLEKQAYPRDQLLEIIGDQIDVMMLQRGER